MDLTDQELNTILTHVSLGPWGEVNPVMCKLIAEVQRRNAPPAPPTEGGSNHEPSTRDLLPPVGAGA